MVNQATVVLCEPIRGWTMHRVNGHTICIVIIWFVLLFGVGLVHPIKDGCQITAAGKH